MALADLTVGTMMNGRISTRHSIKAYSDHESLDYQDVVYENKQFKFLIKDRITAHIRTRKYKSENHKWTNNTIVSSMMRRERWSELQGVFGDDLLIVYTYEQMLFVRINNCSRVILLTKLIHFPPTLHSIVSFFLLSVQLEHIDHVLPLPIC